MARQNATKNTIAAMIQRTSQINRPSAGAANTANIAPIHTGRHTNCAILNVRMSFTNSPDLRAAAALPQGS